MSAPRLTGRLVVLALLVASAAAAGADPAWYRKQSTWHETLIASREALIRAESERGRGRPLPNLGRTPFTIAAWIRTRHDGTVFAKAPARGQWARNGKTLFLRNGRLAFDIGWVGVVRGKTRVADGQWHHVAVARDSAIRFYVDGRADGGGRLEFEPEAKGFAAKIGYTSDNFPRPSGFNGLIAHVRLYDRALSEQQIRAQAARPADDTSPALRGWWPLDGTGADASGQRNHASLPPKARFEPGPGGKGKAVRLDGKQTVLLPSGKAGEAERNQLWDLLIRDFPQKRARAEMEAERAEGLWQSDWPVGDRKGLIGRYVGAIGVGVLAEEARRAGAGGDDRALAAVRAVYHRARRLGAALARVKELNLGSLRSAIVHLQHTYAPRYPRAREFLRRLDDLERRILAAAEQADGSADVAKALARAAEQVALLRREALVAANPLFDFDKLLFVRRYTYSSNHYYTEFINSRWTPGGNLCVLDLKTGKVSELVPELTGGVFERFDLSYDADKVVFAWKCDAQKGYRLYEIGIDPETGRRRGELRQLTFPQENEEELVDKYRARPHYHHGTDDMHPCYLPNGEIVFISTRCQYGILCDGPDDFTTTVLYRMDADGKHMRKLSNSSVSEASPVMMDDGRILYTRWEYVDKGAVSVKCLWAMRPDGSGSVEIYGNDISLPPTFIYARQLPGMPDRYVFLGTPHYPQNGVGTVIRLDMSRNIRSREPMTYITPYVDIQGEPGFAFQDENGRWRRDRNGRGPLFKDPYPLSDKYFLVSHKPAGTEWKDPKGYALYLLDERGRVDLIHRDPEMSCWLPYPLKPRQRPRVPTASIEADLARSKLARCIVTDVYRGLENVERGEVKYIRILEQVPRPWAARRRWGGDSYDQQHVVITKDTHLGLKVQHGVVPVEDDGSAHFLVPADANIFLQVLDKDYMAVQTERTFVNFIPGEVRSCVGCHETQKDASASMAGAALRALQRPPSRPGPQLGDSRGGKAIHYPTLVQPVLDKHCVKCHSGREPKAGLDLSGTMTDLFCRSYENLIPERRRGRGRRGFDLVGPTIGENHPKTGNVHYMPAKSFGSHNSVLVALLTHGRIRLKDPKMDAIAQRLAKEHKDVRLTPSELLRITNWVDTNGQYYGSYWGRRHLKYKGHPNFRPTPTYGQALSYTSPIPEDQR